ncbi:hypothetical protein ACOME3_005002 [Neoechinorhynchus agilis]
MCHKSVQEASNLKHSNSGNTMSQEAEHSNCLSLAEDTFENSESRIANNNFGNKRSKNSNYHNEESNTLGELTDTASHLNSLVQNDREVLNKQLEMIAMSTQKAKGIGSCDEALDWLQSFISSSAKTNDNFVISLNIAQDNHDNLDAHSSFFDGIGERSQYSVTDTGYCDDFDLSHNNDADSIAISDSLMLISRRRDDSQNFEDEGYCDSID